MSLIPNSIRLRLQLWLAFLLICLLTGFGVAAYQLNRQSQFDRLIADLQRRVSLISRVMDQTLARSGPEGGRMRGRGGPGRFPDSGPGPGRNRSQPREARENNAPSPPLGGPGAEDASPGAANPDANPMSSPQEFFPYMGMDLEMGMMIELRRQAALAARFSAFSNRVATLFSGDGESSWHFRVWAPNGRLVFSGPEGPAPLEQPPVARDGSMRLRQSEDCLEVWQYTAQNECILAGKNIAEENKALRSLAAWILAAGGAILALGAGVGWWLTARALKPVEDISAAAARIADGRLSERIQSPDPENEIGRLAGVLNVTFQRLEEAFARQREFTANASHELRTPLAVIMSEAQTTLARARTPEEYREAIQVCLDAARQMSSLTAALLELARYEAGQEPRRDCRFNLAQKTRDVVDMLEPLALERRIAIELDLAEIEITGDPDRLGQVIVNLLSNAIAYNKDQGRIQISLRWSGDAALMEIADTGSGIPPEALPRVFERFYRVDKARARSQGHSGLGLAIVKEIVQAHGGAVTMTSVPGEGSVCAVRLPQPAPAGG